MKRAFTLLELLAVIAVVGVLLGLLMPALSGVRTASKRVGCQANLRSLGQATLMYMDSNRNDLPVARYHASVLTTNTEPFGTLADFIGHPLPLPAHEVDSFSPWACPADTMYAPSTGFSYGYFPMVVFSMLLNERQAQGYMRGDRFIVFYDFSTEHSPRNQVLRDGSVSQMKEN